MRDCEALRRLECNEAEKAELMMFLTPKLCNKKLLTDDSPTATRITVTVTFRFQRLSFRRRSHFCAAIVFLDLFFRRPQANYKSRKSVWLHAEKIAGNFMRKTREKMFTAIYSQRNYGETESLSLLCTARAAAPGCVR